MSNATDIADETDLCNTESRSKFRHKAPQRIRHNETREGGFIVVERTKKKRLLRPSAWPVELDSLATAVVSVRRLQEINPDREFCIFEQVGSFPPEKPE